MDVAVQDMEVSDLLSQPLHTIFNEQKLPQQLIFKTLSGEKFQIFITEDPIEATTLQSIDIANNTKVQETQDKSIPKLAVKEPEKKDISIKCPLCRKTFDKISKYRIHIKQHQNPKKFQCEFCSSSYNKEVNYKIHRVLHHNGPLMCPICDRRFKRNASLKAHLVVHEVEETFSCLHCKQEFDEEDELLKHLEIHEGEEIDIVEKEAPLNCEHCNYVFDDFDKFKEHLHLHAQAKRIVNSGRSRLKRKTKHREYPHKCNNCDKSFPKRCLLLRHQQTHTGEKPFLCTICKKSFSQKGALQIHKKRHEGYKPHKCVFCSASFVQKGNLIAHLQKTHTASKPDEKLYKCTHCTCVFKKISSLNGHVTRVHSNCIHDNEEPDIINVISQLKELDRHLTPQKQINNENNSNHTLNVDSRQNINLQQSQIQQGHENIETSRVSYVKIADSSIKGTFRNYIIKQRTVGEHRWYLCSNCSKEFKKPSDLIRHLRTHTKEKPYKCSECGLTFAQKSTVNNHMATHVKNEFECAICKKHFGSTRSLNVHLKKHEQTTISHKNPIYKCSGCEKTFDDRESANVHMKLHEVVSDDNFLLIEKGSEISETRVDMLQPLIETDQGFFAIPPPKPKTPLATYEEYKNRQFKCHICNAVFGRSAHLKKHMFVHSTKRDFMCSVCSKKFATESALKEHLTNHTKPRKHVCSECNKAFMNSSMLQRHMVCHKSTKPFICPYCKKRFRAKEHCRKHIATHKINNSKLIFAQSNEEHVNLNESTAINDESTELIIFNNIMNSNVLNFQENNSLETGQGSDLAIENSTKEQNVQFHIPEGTTQWFYNFEDSVAQIKLQQPEETFFNQITSLQEPVNYELTGGDPSIILGTDTQMNIHPDTFNPNVIFNPPFDLDITPITKPHDSEYPTVANISNDKQVTIDINAIITDKSTELEARSNPHQLILNNETNNVSTENSDREINYFNIKFKDLLDVPQLHLQDDISTRVDSLFICTKCKGRITNIQVPHVCPGENDNNMENNSQSKNLGVELNPSAETITNEEEKKPPLEFICTKCNKKFNDSQGLNRHMSAKHKTARDNICQFCSKKLEKKSDMDRHLRTHTGEKPFSCTICGKAFAIKSTLKSHLRTHDPNDVKEFQCKVCNSRFRTKSTLKNHMIIHTDKQPFRCEICAKTFKHNHHLKAHLQTHENKSKINAKMNAVNLLKSFVLETNEKICSEQEKHEEEQSLTSGNLFAQQLPVFVDNNMDPVTITLSYENGLQFKIDENMVIPCAKNDYLSQEEFLQPSIKEKKYHCVPCNKFYVSNSVLRKHQRALHGDFKCEKCNKAFNSIELLEKHYLSHNEPRPFHCTVCTNSFCNEANLKVHIKRMHQE